MDTTIARGLQKKRGIVFLRGPNCRNRPVDLFPNGSKLDLYNKKITGRFIEFEPLCASAKDHNRSQILEITILKPWWKRGFGR